MSDDDRDATIAALQADNARLRIAGETGVPAHLLSNASTEAEIQALADAALAWKGDTPPPPPPRTSAVAASTVTSTGRIGYGAEQIRTHSQLVQLSPSERMAAWRAGQLESLGVGPYQPVKRTGH
jgi:hypothetical protein